MTPCPAACRSYSPLRSLFVIVFAAAVTLGSADPTDIASDPDFPAFTRFIAEHRGGQPYHDELETLGRFQIFKKTLARVNQLNSQEIKRSEKHGITRCNPAIYRPPCPDRASPSQRPQWHR